MKHVTLDITGMTCAACATRVGKALSRVDGVADAEVNLALERASVELVGDLSPESLVGAIEKAGYGARLRVADDAAQRRADEARAAERRAEQRQTLLRFALSALLTVPLVIGMLPMMTGTGHAWLGPWTQAALAAGVLAISGTPFFCDAWRTLRAGGANMAVLVSTGTLVAYFASLYEVLRGNAHGHLYFEAAAVVLTLVMLGKYLEARAKGGTSAALTALGRLQPAEAELVEAGGTRVVAASALKRGDLVLVKPGARIPADGTIASGDTTIDESLVTGESLPVARSPGERVLTGTVNGEAAIEVTVTGVGADTRLARIARLVEEAQIGEAPIQRLVDRVSGIFVPAILVIAALTFAVWWLWLGDAEAGLGAAVAVLVIACPCALGLATPTALVAGTGAAARAGILIRDIETLERAQAIRAVAFDKTGTLTVGRPVVAAVAALDGDEAALVRQAAAVEARSEHPLARALLARAEADGIAVPAAEAVRALAGRGLTGRVEGRTVSVGNERLANAEGADDAALAALAQKLGSAGTTAYVLADGRLAGALLFRDEPRAEARAVVQALKARGLTPVMLTGDNEAAARAVAEAVGLADIRASLQPEDKVAAVRALAGEYGDVAFVGDGVNDAPALAASRLGIALSSGTDAAREAAAITLMRPDLRLVPAAFEIAAKTRRTIVHNLVWAFAYNLVCIPLAVAGAFSPALAGAAMAFSSVSVVTNSALLARWRASLS